MHIKTANTQGEYYCIIMGHNDPFGFIGGKDIGPSIGSVSSWLPPVWIAFTRALIVIALKNFFC